MVIYMDSMSSNNPGYTVFETSEFDSNTILNEEKTYCDVSTFMAGFVIFTSIFINKFIFNLLHRIYMSDTK